MNLNIYKKVEPLSKIMNLKKKCEKSAVKTNVIRKLYNVLYN